LAEIVATMLRESDNAIAEMLVKELAVATGGGAGSTAGSAAAVTSTLQSLGVPLANVVMVDGSGLDRANQATCRGLMATLALADDDPHYAVLYDGLAVAGVSGTLRDRLSGTSLEGHLRAKTGFLDDVAGLAGFLDRPGPSGPSAGVPTAEDPGDGRRVVFAFIVNEPASDDELRNYRVQVGTVLNDWLVQALDPATLAPSGS
jgi:D-alanyl-D-alanine carboxypeptidase/D-alanyl-D-alanine-endopeptidase (penicillin-binding protein 4)